MERIRDSGVTVVLVTHFMDEAERLCDRIMVVVDGRTVATETPAGLIRLAGFEHTLRFYPSAPVDEDALFDIPDVTRLEHVGKEVVVSGTGDVIYSVVLALARAGVVAHDLRIEQAGLEDAYLTLTGSLPGEGAGD